MNEELKTRSDLLKRVHQDVVEDMKNAPPEVSSSSSDVTVHLTERKGQFFFRDADDPEPCSTQRKAVVSDKWACAVASTDVPVNKNSHITDQLEAMVETFQSTNDHWRALGYEKAIIQLKRHPTEIATWEVNEYLDE
ncbi:hypothetical protein V5799_031399 [Amblyomma americanum]|uniref:Uncharacterized protein n=1 Tax=Amblyomma americanum TaxID=6943 RepID=A0AAQ4EKH1_AMBAM